MNFKVLCGTHIINHIRGIIKGEINLTVIEHNNTKTHTQVIIGLRYLLSYIVQCFVLNYEIKG